MVHVADQWAAYNACNIVDGFMVCSGPCPVWIRHIILQHRGTVVSEARIHEHQQRPSRSPRHNRTSMHNFTILRSWP
jgi:hypothetical protein